MSYQASHDALTGLVNRREFEHRLEEALEATHGGARHVLCYLDLDRFKAVNDECGHVAGDNMLREIAALIKEAVRDSDTVGRLGGDEFGILLAGCPLEKARQIADDVVRAVNDHRFVWKDKIFTVGVSVGLVEMTSESGSIEDLLHAADSACYVAKTQGGRVQVYSARDEAAARQRGEILWLQLLQSALKENRFELYAQPIVQVAATPVQHGGPALEVLLRLKDEPGRSGRARRLHACGGALPADAARRPLGGADGADGARPRRRAARAWPQPVHQSLWPDARRRGLSRVRRGMPRPYRRDTRSHLLRSDRELGHHQHRARAPLHRRAARHGLPLRARRFRPRPQFVRQPEESVARLPEDRWLFHPQPRVGQRQPGHGQRR